MDISAGDAAARAAFDAVCQALESQLTEFAVASYDTDHLLVSDLRAAVTALRVAGHQVVGAGQEADG